MKAAVAPEYAKKTVISDVVEIFSVLFCAYCLSALD